MSADLDAFLDTYAELARQGSVSPLSGTERIMLEAYDAWLVGRRRHEEDLRTDEEKALGRAIVDAAPDGREVARRIFEYYRDADRADRTPRAAMYLHMGVLTGAFMESDRAARALCQKEST